MTATQIHGQQYLPTFESSFLERHARRILLDPEVALVELIANCWDAGACHVDIVWPEDDSEDRTMSISDDGMGMTPDEFIQRWRTLSYDRLSNQGPRVIFPEGYDGSERIAYGRNGKGRLAMFCFGSAYTVRTTREGVQALFQVTRTDSKRAPYALEHVADYSVNGDEHGTMLEAKDVQVRINAARLAEVLGARFVADPSFTITVNGERVVLDDLGALAVPARVAIDGRGDVLVYTIDAQSRGRTTRHNGVTWWIDKRSVGSQTWDRRGSRGTFLDGRGTAAHRYSFVVQADSLRELVEEDWTGFRRIPESTDAIRSIEDHIDNELDRLLARSRRTRKREALSVHREQIRHLPPASKNYIGEFLDELQQKCPSVNQQVLTDMVSVLAKLEHSRTGYRLVADLAKLSADDLSSLHTILSSWSVHNAQVVLDELERRMNLIAQLENLVDDPSADELHVIHPLFENGLWIFGPEFESVQFRSNRAMLTVLRDMFGEHADIGSEGRTRPDLVAVAEGIVSVYSCDSYDEDGEADDIGRVLVVELKRGGSRVSYGERTQGEKYANVIADNGRVGKDTRFDVFVLGSTVAREVRGTFKTNSDRTWIRCRSYQQVIRRAHGRTFHLLERIREASSGPGIDQDVQEVLAQGALAGMPSPASR